MTTELKTDSSGNFGAIAFKGTDNIKLVTTGPELQGTPKAPTAAAGNNTTQVATTAFVAAAVAGITANNPTPSTITPIADAPAATIGTSAMYARGDHVHPQFALAGTNTPSQVAASGSAGSATAYSRSDHVHPAGAQSLNQNGYITLPGGLIMQWGFATFTPSGISVSFSVPFPNSCFNVIATANSSSVVDNCTVDFQTTTGFIGRSTNSVGCFWQALGR